MWEKYAYLSKLKEWTRRQVGYSQSDFNGYIARSGAWQAETPNMVTRSITLSSVQVPSPVPMVCTFFPYIA
jgi:hypothetical protein